MREKISIIIPVYNTETYLEECVRSAVSQSYTDLEILVIDDGSGTVCRSLCDQLAGTDSRIRVIHQENKGLSGARNRGLEECTGDWILFVDSDDTISRVCCARAYAYGLRQHADVVVFGYERFFEEKRLKPDIHGKTTLQKKSRVWSKEEAMLSLLDNRFGNYSWNRLCRRSLYQGVRFPENRLYEDIGTTWKLMEKAERVCYLNEPLYQYRQHPGTITRAGRPKALKDDFLMREELWNHILEHYPQLAKGNEVFILPSAIRLCTGMRNKTDSEMAARAFSVIKNAEGVPEILGVRQKTFMRLMRILT